MVNKSDGGFAAIYRDATHDIIRVVPLSYILQCVAVDD